MSDDIKKLDSKSSDVIVYRSSEEYKDMPKEKLQSIINKVKEAFPDNQILYICGNEDVFSLSENKMNSIGWFRMGVPNVGKGEKVTDITKFIEKMELEFYLKEKAEEVAGRVAEEIKKDMPGMEVKVTIGLFIKKKE